MAPGPASRVVPCFTPGTRIATAEGEVPVQRLRIGDRVVTRDNGLQPILWIGRAEVGFKEMARAPHLAPVRIAAGAFGHGLPERDMMLSPNHRVLVANDRTSLYFDAREVFVAAKHLVDHRGVQVVEPVRLSYIHFMCAGHEVVLSDGAWSESFQPNDYSLKGLGNAQRQELYELFPELAAPQGRRAYDAARPVLRGAEARVAMQG